jgi:hypothetical protein
VPRIALARVEGRLDREVGAAEALPDMAGSLAQGPFRLGTHAGLRLWSCVVSQRVPAKRLLSQAPIDAVAVPPDRSCCGNSLSSEVSHHRVIHGEPATFDTPIAGKVCWHSYPSRFQVLRRSLRPCGSTRSPCRTRRMSTTRLAMSPTSRSTANSTTARALPLAFL